MRKKIEWLWEKLDEGTWRAKVIGGWLILHCHQTIFSGKKPEVSVSESMVFIADRDHEWHIIEPAPLAKESKVGVKASDFVGPKDKFAENVAKSEFDPKN